MKYLPYIFLIPAIIFFLLFSVYPTIKIFAISFTTVRFLDSTLVWFDNYFKILKDTTFHQSIINTLLFVIIIVPTKILFALFIAVFVYDMRKWVQDYVRFAFYLPTFTSGIIISNVFKWIFKPTSKGLVNSALESMGFEKIIFFNSSLTAVIPIAIIMILTMIGFEIIIYLAVMNDIPHEQIEAAEIDGCSWWKIKTRIILPQMLPAIFLTVLLSIIGIFQIFEYIYMLAPYAHSSTIMYDIYITGFVKNRMGMSTTKSVILLLIIVIVSVIKNRIERVFK